MAKKSGSDGVNHFWIDLKIAILGFLGMQLHTFYQDCFGDHIHASNFENRGSFFPQGTKLSAEIVFRTNT